MSEHPSLVSPKTKREDRSVQETNGSKLELLEVKKQLGQIKTDLVKIQKQSVQETSGSKFELLNVKEQLVQTQNDLVKESLLNVNRMKQMCEVLDDLRLEFDAVESEALRLLVARLQKLEKDEKSG